MSRNFAIVLVILFALFGGLFVVSKNKAKQDTATSESSSSAQVSKHTEGEGKKGVTLVEYGDYQCPACTAYFPLVKSVVEKYKSDITFQFVNYPLTQIHPNAMAAHRAAEAASLQNKFWEMHDLLYQNHDAWANAGNASTAFEQYAQQLGLDVTKFKQDVASSAVNGVIQADIKQGQNLKVTGTPTFFLNGKKIDQAPQDEAGFNKLIDDAIAAKSNQ